MKLQPQGKGKFIYLTGLCTMVYFISYVTRINLSAVMVEVVGSGFADSATVALALSVCSVTYGAGQLISGFLGDRFKPQNVVLTGFLVTGAVNMCVSQLQEEGWLVALWAINGVAQACMWPPLVAILASHFEQEEYRRATKWTAWGSAFGTIAVYALAPVVIRMLNYRYVFLIGSILALGMAAVWKLLYELHFGHSAKKRVETASAEPEKTPMPHKLLWLMGAVMLVIMLQGALRDGVSNWMPTLLSETFRLDSASAILTGVLLPVFHILCTQLASRLHTRLRNNELYACGVFFALTALLALVLWAVSGQNVILSVVLLAMIVGCVHGINFELTCLAPEHYKRYGHIGLVSGALNSSTYIGSALSTYGIALFSGSFGWGGVILLWMGIALAGMGVCLTLWRRWERFIREK